MTAKNGKRDGAPLLISASERLGENAAHWLARIEQCAAMLPTFPQIPAEAVKQAMQAGSMVRLARRAIEVGDAEGAAWAAMAAIHHGWIADTLTGAMPKILRDAKRQKGTQAPKGSRMPQLDEWLDGILSTAPGTSDKELLRMLEREGNHGDLYLDGETVVEISAAGKERNLTPAGFAKRVTAARKRVSQETP